MTDIAAALELNPIYLNRIFKLSTGKTLLEYLNFYRIQAACQMMCQRRYTLPQIIAAVGYTDPRSFNRYFKRQMGKSPSEYFKKPL